jgi:iron complex outermembrane receptor protein
MLFKARVPAQHWYALDEAGWRLAYSLNHFRFKEFADQGVDYSGKQIPGVPGQFLFTGISLSLAGGIYARADLSLSGRMPMNDLNTHYSDAYHVLDLTLGYRKAFGKWKLDFYGSVNNLTRQHYASMVLVNAPSFGNALPRYYYPGLPINYAVGLRLAYLKQ